MDFLADQAHQQVLLIFNATFCLVSPMKPVMDEMLH